MIAMTHLGIDSDSGLGLEERLRWSKRAVKERERSVEERAQKGESTAEVEKRSHYARMVLKAVQSEASQAEKAKEKRTFGPSQWMYP